MEKNLKIIPKTLILIPDLSVAGGVGNYYSILDLHTADGISYFVINKQKSISHFIPITRLIKNYLKFIFKLIRYQYKIVVINPSLNKRSFYRDLVFIIIANLLNRKTIVFFRGWTETYEKQIKRSHFKSFLFRISYARVDKYILLGIIFKNKLIKMGVPSNASFLIETTVADSSYLNELSLEKKYLAYESEITFLFLARIIKEKGVSIAIEAFHLYSQRYPQRKSRLIIAGDGPDLLYAKSYVKEKKIPNILFLGHVSGENKKKVLIESHVIIFPSFSEGLPNTVLEGMLYGMPIVSRCVGGIPEIIEDNVNGFLTESFKPEVFANFLFILASNNKLYKKISETNNKIALEKFTSEKVKVRLLKVFESLQN